VAVAAVFYIVAGALHFIKPAPYLKIMPPYIPWHAAMVGVSGFFEILGGLALLMPAAGRTARARVCASEKVCPAFALLEIESSVGGMLSVRRFTQRNSRLPRFIDDAL